MAAAVATPAKKGDPSYSHAVSRSSELLSCAKTALKIGKAQHAYDDDHGGSMWWACQDPNMLALCNWKDHVATSHLDGLCEDGISLLRAMDAELTHLETLVRRRGHTNDPTEEISRSVGRLETDAKELSSLVKTGFVFPGATSQYQRHTQLIATWLESVATKQMAKLKEILKVRGNVLADQAQRRKLLNPQGNSNSNGTNNGANNRPQSAMTSLEPKKMAPKAMDTPLFNMKPLPKPAYGKGNYTNGAALSSQPTAAAASSAPTYARVNPYGGGGATGGYGGGGGGYGGGTGSYYGGGGPPSTSGMRQRRPKASSGMMQQDNPEQDAAQIQMQIQKRQQQRQTETRLQEAQQAERTLAELGTMFSKMTNLISQQAEVLENIEDDVEAGLAEVSAGQEEITTLYALKKGNRGLIIKVFSLLIFFIIFMRFYKRS